MISEKFVKEFKRLNDKQREAVETIEGPVLVVAGPGTGKTQVLAMRIANILVKTQTEAGNILCLTFTNSGVFAMKKRLLEIIGPESYKVHVHTFHSFCNEIIQTFPEKFLFNQKLEQISDLEQILLIQKILDGNDFEVIKPMKAPYYYQSALLDNIKKLKQESVEPKQFFKMATDQKTKELAKVYSEYQKNLKKNGFYDYEDMIVFVTKSLRKDSELLSYYQEKFQYILVDEYQDTNNSQNEIVQLLSSFYESPNLFAVGDDEQSIFRFQGASLENILNFLKNYPEAKTIMLEDNYRSGQEILDLARASIEHNDHQIYKVLNLSKKLVSQTKTKTIIKKARFTSDAVEDYFIATSIKKLVKEGHRPAEIAVIYKEHRDGFNLAETLAKLKIPFSQIKTENILETPEIEKIIKLLEIIDDPYNDINLFEVLNYSFFKFDTLELYKLVRYASEQKLKLFDLLAGSKNGLKFTKLMAKTSSNFINLTFAQAFENLINESGYLKYLLKLPDAPQQLNKLKTLFDEIKILNAKNKNLRLKNFLNYLTDLQKNHLAIKEELMDTNFQGVRLLTAHQAKGQEFETVFIMHLTDKHWGNFTKRELIKLPPGILKTDTLTNDNEEQRRLFYVALTRAKKNLFLTFADKYSRSTTFSVPSQFLTELPEIDLVKTDTYEKQILKRLELSLKPVSKVYAKKVEAYLAELTEKLVLSATSFNAYVACPKKFFYNQLLRVPKVKDFNLSYGSAVHFALEKFFKDQIKSFKVPDRAKLIGYFYQGLKKEILTETEFRRAKIQGKKNLERYYDFFVKDWQNRVPVAAEYNFGFHHVHFGNIPITGKIDKLEILDKVSGKVKIIDYKTSAPKSLNYLLGKTAEKDTSFLYQAFFYKLLAENDPLFTWKVGSVEFEFLSPKNDKFVKVEVPIDDKNYQDFLQLLEKVYQNIKKLEFSTKGCNSNERYPCDFKALCGAEK